MFWKSWVEAVTYFANGEDDGNGASVWRVATSSADQLTSIVAEWDLEGIEIERSKLDSAGLGWLTDKQYEYLKRNIRFISDKIESREYKIYKLWDDLKIQDEDTEDILLEDFMTQGDKSTFMSSDEIEGVINWFIAASFTEDEIYNIFIEVLGFQDGEYILSDTVCQEWGIQYLGISWWKVWIYEEEFSNKDLARIFQVRTKEVKYSEDVFRFTALANQCGTTVELERFILQLWLNEEQIWYLRDNVWERWNNTILFWNLCVKEWEARNTDLIIYDNPILKRETLDAILNFLSNDCWLNEGQIGIFFVSVLGIKEGGYHLWPLKGTIGDFFSEAMISISIEWVKIEWMEGSGWQFKHLWIIEEIWVE